MNKTLVLSLTNRGINENNIDEQVVKGETNDGIDIYYNVFDLWEYPEDAVLGRDLFTAEEFIKTIKLGMHLAKEGYENIEVVQSFEKTNY